MLFTIAELIVQWINWAVVHVQTTSDTYVAIICTFNHRFRLQPYVASRMMHWCCVQWRWLLAVWITSAATQLNGFHSIPSWFVTIDAHVNGDGTTQVIGLAIRFNGRPLDCSVIAKFGWTRAISCSWKFKQNIKFSRSCPLVMVNNLIVQYN